MSETFSEYAKRILENRFKPLPPKDKEATKGQKPRPPKYNPESNKKSLEAQMYYEYMVASETLRPLFILCLLDAHENTIEGVNQCKPKERIQDIKCVPYNSDKDVDFSDTSDYLKIRGQILNDQGYTHGYKRIPAPCSQEALILLCAMDEELVEAGMSYEDQIKRVKPYFINMAKTPPHYTKLNSIRVAGNYLLSGNINYATVPPVSKRLPPENETWLRLPLWINGDAAESDILNDFKMVLDACLRNAQQYSNVKLHNKKKTGNAKVNSQMEISPKAALTALSFWKIRNTMDKPENMGQAVEDAYNTRGEKPETYQRGRVNREAGKADQIFKYLEDRI